MQITIGKILSLVVVTGYAIFAMTHAGLTGLATKLRLVTSAATGVTGVTCGLDIAGPKAQKQWARCVTG